MVKKLLCFLLLLSVFLFSGCATGYMKMLKAAKAGDMASAEAMIAQEPAMLLEEDYDGRTPLMYAAMEGSIDTVKMLVKSGADINYPSKKNKSTALIWASAANKPEMVKFLLSKGADKNSVNDINAGAVHNAAANNAIDALKVLVAAGCKADEKDKERRTPVMLAAEYGHKDTVKYFLANKLCDESLVLSPLMKAMILGKKEEVSGYIKEKKFMDKVDTHGKTTLIWAAITGDAKTAEAFGYSWAEKNKMDKYGQTAVMWAVMANQMKVLSVLCEMNSDLDLQEYSRGKTALMIAAKLGNSEAANILIKNKANLFIYDKNNNTALWYANYYNYYDIKKMLMRSGLNIDSKPREKK